MGLKMMGLPHALYDHMTDPVPFRHHARTPMGGIVGLDMQGVVDDPLEFAPGNDGFASAAFADLLQCIGTAFSKSASPEQYGWTAHTQLRCDAAVRHSLGRQENDGGAQGDPLGCGRSANQDV